MRGGGVDGLLKSGILAKREENAIFHHFGQEACAPHKGCPRIVADWDQTSHREIHFLESNQSCL